VPLVASCDRTWVRRDRDEAANRSVTRRGSPTYSPAPAVLGHRLRRLLFSLCVSNLVGFGVGNRASSASTSVSGRAPFRLPRAESSAHRALDRPGRPALNTARSAPQVRPVLVPWPALVPLVRCPRKRPLLVRPRAGPRQKPSPFRTSRLICLSEGRETPRAFPCLSVHHVTAGGVLQGSNFKSPNPAAEDVAAMPEDSLSLSYFYLRRDAPVLVRPGHTIPRLCRFLLFFYGPYCSGFRLANYFGHERGISAYNTRDREPRAAGGRRDVPATPQCPIYEPGVART